MKKGKKIVIGVAAVAVVAGGVYAVAGGSRGEAQLPQVSVTKAEQNLFVKKSFLLLTMKYLMQ